MSFSTSYVRSHTSEESSRVSMGSSSWFSNRKTYESLEKGKDGTRTWTYLNQPVEYRAIADNKKVIIHSLKNGKKQEMTLNDEQAKKVRSLLEKMNFLAGPISPIKPIMPIKPIAPILFSFDDPKDNQNKLNGYSKELNAYKKECEEKMAGYQTELAKYEEKAKLYSAQKKEHEAARAELIHFLGKILTNS